MFNFIYLFERFIDDLTLIQTFQSVLHWVHSTTFEKKKHLKNTSSTPCTKCTLEKDSYIAGTI